MVIATATDMVTDMDTVMDTRYKIDTISLFSIRFNNVSVKDTPYKNKIKKESKDPALTLEIGHNMAQFIPPSIVVVNTPPFFIF